MSNITEVESSQRMSSIQILQNGVPQDGNEHKTCVVETILNERGFLDIAGEWAHLHSNSTFPSPFTSWEWCWAWWRHFGAQKELRIAIVRDGDGELVAVAPFYVSADPLFLMSRELRMIGDDGRDGEGMTDEPILLLGLSHRSEAVERLLEYVSTGPGSVGWDAAKLRLPTSRSAAEGDVAHAISELPYWRIRWKEGCQVVSLPNSWSVFRRSLSRSMKDNLAYYPRRMQKQGFEFTVELVRNTKGVLEAVDLLADLHNERAKNERGPYHGSHIPGNKQVAFLRDCLTTLAELGMASIAVMKVDGAVVAAQAMLESPRSSIRGRELVVYYSGYSSAWHDYSPVTILGATAIEDAITRGVDRVNFLPGEMQWKSRWGTSELGSIAELRNLRSHPTSFVRAFYRSAVRQAAIQRMI